MPKKPHTELDIRDRAGPWVTIRDGDDHLTVNFRAIISDAMPAQPPRERRIMARWLRARVAEERGIKTLPPPPENERKPLPASRKIPPRTLKR